MVYWYSLLVVLLHRMGIRPSTQVDTPNHSDRAATRNIRNYWPHRLNVRIEKGVAVLMKNLDGWLEKNFEKMAASALDEPMSEEDMVNAAIDYEIEKQSTIEHKSEEEKVAFWEEMHRLDTEAETELNKDNLDLDFHEVVGPLRQHKGTGHPARQKQLPM